MTLQVLQETLVDPHNKLRKYKQAYENVFILAHQWIATLSHAL